MKYYQQEQALEIVNNSIDAILTVDTQGVIQFCNQATEHMFGYARDELIGQTINILMTRDYASHHDRYIQHYISSGESRIMGSAGTIVFGIHKDGHPIAVNITLSESYTSSGHMFHASIRDLRLIEAHLQQQRQGVCTTFLDLYQKTYQAINDEIRMLQGSVDNQTQLQLQELLQKVDGLYKDARDYVKSVKSEDLYSVRQKTS